MYQEILWRLTHEVVSQESSWENALLTALALKERGISSAKASMSGEVLVRPGDVARARAELKRG